MLNLYLNISKIDIIFISTLLIVISNILTKLDPKLSNLINKITFEKKIYNLNLNLITLTLLYILQLILIIEFQSTYIR